MMPRNPIAASLGLSAAERRRPAHVASYILDMIEIVITIDQNALVSESQRRSTAVAAGPVSPYAAPAARRAARPPNRGPRRPPYSLGSTPGRPHPGRPHSDRARAPETGSLLVPARG